MSGATRFFLLLSTAPLPRLRLHLHRRSFLRSFLRLPHSSSLSPATRRHHSLASPRASHQFHTQTSNDQLGTSSPHHPWPHWDELIRNLSAAGYFHRQGIGWEEGELISDGELPDRFVRAANACLVFARERPDILGKLPRRDIEVVVENGFPFLFRNAQESASRIRLFLCKEDNKVLVSDEAHMVDLMRFLVSYASCHIVSSEKNSRYNMELVESSVQNLVSELVKLISNIPERQQNQFLDRSGQTPKLLGKTIEMKRGDWICSRCTFMNFAKNVECRECQESRPKRQLTGEEWTCPQCDYYNHRKNSVCLRCDCNRPGHVSLGETNSRSGLDYGNERYVNSVDGDSSRFAANEEKAQSWLSKVSQLDGTSDKNNTVVGEDFPEIMPLRKGVNRFVVSTRKTPLERRLADAQYRRNSDSDGSPEGSNLQSEDGNDKSAISGQNARLNSSSTPYRSTGGSSYIPFVPLPADRFAKEIESPKTEESVTDMINEDDSRSVITNSTEQIGAISGIKDPDRSRDSIQLSEKPMNQTSSKDGEQEGTEKSERWYKRISELHNVEDLASAIPDEDFPEVMPLRKGDNRFVISNKKDRSLTSPMYKRRMAMEQTNNNNYVPFVPLPADYFAKKDKPHTTNKVTTEEKLLKRPDESRSTIISDIVEKIEKQSTSTKSTDSLLSRENHTGTSINPENGDKERWSSGYKGKGNETTNPSATSVAPSENQNSRGWSGKSLEGSAVKEADPLDMSEEAKAERWFRRVAQIKDISELSQIPDEDFPSIMPMRKGVNRFVVSKRKTPMERRLISPQYRKNLPIVSSDPPNKENEGS